MYLGMDEIGSDNVRRLRSIKDKELVWSEIERIAAGFGYRGIQFTSSLYERKLGLSLKRIPDIFRDYRLTYHVAGIRPLISANDENELEALLAESLNIACANKMEDVSFHPPRLATDGDRRTVRSKLAHILTKWLPRYAERGITLSLESHSGGRFFVFDGLPEFSDFVSGMPELGVLADLSHLWNDGNNANAIAAMLESCRSQLTGFHVSDAIAHMDDDEGTHLPIGQGEVDFDKILAPYAADDSVYAVFEVKAESPTIRQGIDLLRKYGGPI